MQLFGLVSESYEVRRPVLLHVLAALRLNGLPYLALTLSLTTKPDTSGFSRDLESSNNRA